MHLLSRKNIIFVLTLVILLAPMFFVYAVAPYQLLVGDLPLIGAEVTPGEGGGVGRYLNNIFKIGLGIAVTLAVLMFVYNGVIYMTSDIVGSVEGAKKAFYSIVGGLVLVFSSVLILGQINPDLVNFGLFDRLNAIEAPADSGDGGTQPPATGSAEADLRAQLRDAGITVNKPACTQPGQTNCTNVAGLPPTVVTQLISLAESCACGGLVITGGTESWLHETHGVGLPMVDLRKDSGITNFIRTRGTFLRKQSGGDLYSYGGSEFWDEPGTQPHWHSCIGTTCRFE